MDSIDTSSLLVRAAAYNSTNQLKATPEDSIAEAGQFQDIVNVNFNKFAKMSPEQILGHIKSIKESAEVTPSSNGVVSGFVKNASNVLKNQDRVLRQSLVEEASLLDIVTVTNEAKSTIQTMVAVRDKFFEAFEKVMSMQI